MIQSFINNRKGIIKAAIDEANKSVYKQRMGAVIFNHKRIIARGYNKSLSWAQNHHPRFRRFATSIHAEIATILNARTDLKGFDMVVVRINNHGELRNGMPCIYCLSYLSFVKIRRCYYSLSEEPWFDFIDIPESMEVCDVG